MLKILKRKRSMILVLSLSILFWVIMGMLFVRLAAKKTQFRAVLGETQLELIEKYTKGEQILFYIDQASKYSVYQSIYDLGLQGGFFEYKCGEYRGYGLWRNEYEEMEYCLPDYKKNFNKFVTTRLDSYLSKEIFGINIPLDNYDFVFEENGKTKIHGIATIPISIPILCGKEEGECGVYKIKPSFSHEIPYNFITKFEEYAEKAKEIEENIRKCLEKGSYRAGDDDFITCSKIDNLKKEIEDIDNYEITPLISEPVTDLVYDIEVKPLPPDRGLDKPDQGPKLHTNKVYTLLFKIEDDSFQNPYSDEKLITKYAIRFADNFPPLATEIITDQNNKPLKKDNAWYLVWQTNNASDVVGYKIYYKKIEKTLDGREIPSTPPTDIEKMDNKYDPIIIRAPLTEWLISGLEGNYYFFIIAGDDANNAAKDIITKRVTIPSIEEAQQEQVTDLSELFNIQ